jgi:hypothetical protein
VKVNEDIFHPIPTRLPSQREIAHTIPLDEGHESPLGLFVDLVLWRLKKPKDKLHITSTKGG